MTSESDLLLDIERQKGFIEFLKDKIKSEQGTLERAKENLESMRKEYDENFGNLNN